MPPEDDEVASTDLGKALSEAYDEQVALESKTPASPPPSPSPSPAPTPTPAPAPTGSTPPPPAPAAPAVQAPVPAPAPRPIPERLKGKWADKWETLDPALKEEFHGYETNIGSLASKYGQQAKNWENVQKVFAPYEPLIRAEGGDIFGTMANLLETSRLLRQGSPEQKLGILRAMVQNFKLPVEALLPQQGAAAPAGASTAPSSPSMVAGPSEALAAEVASIKRSLLTREAEERHTVNARVASEVQAFLADPANSHIKDFGDDYLAVMTSLIQSGQATNIKDAYEKAAWLHPQARQLEVTKMAQQRLQEQGAAAAAAKAAAVSQNGNSPGTVTRDPAKMTLRETLAAAFDGELDS